MIFTRGVKVKYQVPIKDITDTGDGLDLAYIITP